MLYVMLYEFGVIAHQKMNVWYRFGLFRFLLCWWVNVAVQLHLYILAILYPNLVIHLVMHGFKTIL